MDGIVREVEASGPDPVSSGPPEQIDLFAERARIARDLDAALRDGDFPVARRLMRLFEETYGASEEIRALAFLDRHATALASPLPKEAVAAWRDVDPCLEGHPRLRRLLAQGVLGRLLESHPASALVSADPGALPAIARMLARGPNPEDGRRAARRLVRDALLAGRRPESVDFDWDGAVADLLAEDEAPAWLACLGALRRLWPASRPGEEMVAALLSGPFREPASPEEAGEVFWSCLQAAEDRGSPEPLMLEARRRMKRLNPAFHALYMRRAAPWS
jgi:hypothetical protein